MQFQLYNWAENQNGAQNPKFGTYDVKIYFIIFT